MEHEDSKKMKEEPSICNNCGNNYPTEVKKCRVCGVRGCENCMPGHIWMCESCEDKYDQE